MAPTWQIAAAAGSVSGGGTGAASFAAAVASGGGVALVHAAIAIQHGTSHITRRMRE